MIGKITYKILDENVSNFYDIDSLLETFDNMFNELGADSDDYDWMNLEIDDMGAICYRAKENLIEAAIEHEVLPELSTYDFDFDGEITYELQPDDDIIMIEECFEEFENLTRLSIQIKQ